MACSWCWMCHIFVNSTHFVSLQFHFVQRTNSKSYNDKKYTSLWKIIPSSLTFTKHLQSIPIYSYFLKSSIKENWYMNNSFTVTFVSSENSYVDVCVNYACSLLYPGTYICVCVFYYSSWHDTTLDIYMQYWIWLILPWNHTPHI